jgi:hypothetical protein
MRKNVKNSNGKRFNVDINFYVQSNEKVLISWPDNQKKNIIMSLVTNVFAS